MTKTIDKKFEISELDFSTEILKSMDYYDNIVEQAWALLNGAKDTLYGLKEIYEKCQKDKERYKIRYFMSESKILSYEKIDIEPNWIPHGN